MSWLQTVEMTRILENNSGGKMELAICWSGSSHLYPWRQKSYCPSHIVARFMDVLLGVIHTRTLLFRKLTVSYSDTFKRLINVISSIALICPECNRPYQCGALQICFQLDEQLLVYQLNTWWDDNILTSSGKHPWKCQFLTRIYNDFILFYFCVKTKPIKQFNNF